MKKKKTRNTLVNVKRLLGTAKGHITAFVRGLSNNNGVLGNGCVIRCINAFPYYRSTSKGAHYFHRVFDLEVISMSVGSMCHKPTTLQRCLLLVPLAAKNWSRLLFLTSTYFPPKFGWSSANADSPLMATKLIKNIQYIYKFLVPTVLKETRRKERTATF